MAANLPEKRPAQPDNASMQPPTKKVSQGQEFCPIFPSVSFHWHRLVWSNRSCR
jgi:hypothetical protein